MKSILCRMLQLTVSVGMFQCTPSLDSVLLCPWLLKWNYVSVLLCAWGGKSTWPACITCPWGKRSINNTANCNTVGLLHIQATQHGAKRAERLCVWETKWKATRRKVCICSMAHTYLTAGSLGASQQFHLQSFTRWPAKGLAPEMIWVL